jgi:uncharacterized membrane protein HdeD (DUF308 family)
MLRCMPTTPTPEVHLRTNGAGPGSPGARPRLFLTRGLVAIAWALVFAVTSDSLTTGVGVLLVLYPLIDAVSSVIDARGQQGSARQLLELNAAVSAVAAVALGIAATGDKGDVLVVFGVWALLAGGAQLVVAIRRRMILGRQWPLLLAGAGSTIFGIAFLVMAGSDDPKLEMVAVYAATGGVDFIIQAWLLARRTHRVAEAT